MLGSHSSFARSRTLTQVMPPSGYRVFFFYSCNVCFYWNIFLVSSSTAVVVLSQSSARARAFSGQRAGNVSAHLFLSPQHDASVRPKWTANPHTADRWRLRRFPRIRDQSVHDPRVASTPAFGRWRMCNRTSQWPKRPEECSKYLCPAWAATDAAFDSPNAR